MNALPPSEARADECPAASDTPFDSAALLASVNGSHTTLNGLLNDCRDEDFPGLFSQISAALAAGDLRQLQRAAHAVKGVLGVFHAPAAFEAARRLEESARLGDSNNVTRQSEELRAAVSKLLSALEEFVGPPAPACQAA